MKVTCKKTGKDITRKIIINIEKDLITQGYKLFKVNVIKQSDGTYKKVKTKIKY